MHQLAQEICRRLETCYPHREAQALTRILCCEVLGQRDVDFYLGKDTNLSENDRRKVEDIICRLLHFEPIQYIQGEAPFMGWRLKVTPDVLIPRPETAELVELIASQWASTPQPLRLLDIGTGSGCIAVTLAHLLPQAEVEAWDLSPAALAVARENATRVGCRVSFSQHDVLTFQPPSHQHSHYDLIVSNPPYIRECEAAQMERNVLDWEPRMALFVPDSDPLRFYRRIATLGHQLLRPQGMLYFEINRAYGAEVVQLLQDQGYRQVELLNDLQGNPRMVYGRKD